MGERISLPERVFKGVSVVDGAGVKLKRIIGSGQLDHVDPFVLLDEFRSDNPRDYIAGFPTHPHRGIETITYMIHGRFEHRDSKGNAGTLTSGTVQWMTAGRGILHSEMPGTVDGLLWGYQLWLSLKAKDKMVLPRYQHLSAEMIPVYSGDGATVKVISGEFEGLTGPAQNWVPASYFDVRLERGASFRHSLGPEVNRFVYVHTGSVSADLQGDSKFLRTGEAAILDSASKVVLEGRDEENGLLFLAGKPNGEPIVRGGPFVMNTEEEIWQAFDDYRKGRIQV